MRSEAQCRREPRRNALARALAMVKLTFRVTGGQKHSEQRATLLTVLVDAIVSF